MLNIYTEYFFRIFMTTICDAYVIINSVILSNISAEYFFRIFIPNISLEYLHV